MSEEKEVKKLNLDELEGREEMEKPSGMLSIPTPGTRKR